MSTPTSIANIISWLAAVHNRFAYSQGSGRLNPVVSGYTDCSGLMAYAFEHFANLYIGTYTGNECTHGVLVTQSKSAARDAYGMLPGDLIFYRWSNRAIGLDPYDHVNMYIGNGQVESHGGPDYGPDVESLATNVNNAYAVMVRRYVQPVNVPLPPKPPVTANPIHGHPVPTLIARGTGDYYGLITGPNQSHGGAYVSEQPNIKLIQGFLNWHQRAGLTVNGIFGTATFDAVKLFQERSMPGTEFFGQVWYDDWAKMASL